MAVRFETFDDHPLQGVLIAYGGRSTHVRVVRREGENWNLAIARHWHLLPGYALTGKKVLHVPLPTLAEWFDVWFELRFEKSVFAPKRAATRTRESTLEITRFWTKRLGNTRVDQIAANDLLAVMNKQKWSPNTRAKHIKKLRTCFSDLQKHGWCGWRASHNPAEGVPIRQESGTYDRLTKNEVPVFLKAYDTVANQSARTFIRLCLFAGLRAGEASSVRWGWIDQGEQWAPAAGVIRFPADAVKERRHKVLPFSQSLARALPPRGAHHELVCGRDDKSINAALAAAERAVGRRITPHCLRVTFACMMHFEAGAGLKEVQKLLGHGSPATTMKYLRAPEGDLRERVAFDVFGDVRY